MTPYFWWIRDLPKGGHRWNLLVVAVALVVAVVWRVVAKSRARRAAPPDSRTGSRRSLPPRDQQPGRRDGDVFDE